MGLMRWHALLTCNEVVLGSIPTVSTHCLIAQLVEHDPDTIKVSGSIPLKATVKLGERQLSPMAGFKLTQYL